MRDFLPRTFAKEFPEKPTSINFHIFGISLGEKLFTIREERRLQRKTARASTVLPCNPRIKNITQEEIKLTLFMYFFKYKLKKH